MLVRRLSLGPWMEVCEATGASGTRVTLKRVLLPFVDDPRALADLDREAEALQALAETRVPRLVGQGVDARLPWLARSWVDGVAWSAVPPEQRLRRMRQLAVALAEIHARGWIHGDIAPANVLATAEDVCLIDVALARPADHPDPTLASRGTPAFQAPEQVRGTTVGPAADVFALGAVFASMWLGASPFAGASRVACAARLLAHTGAVASPADAPHAQWQVVVAMLAPDPRDRPTAADVAEKLRG